MRNRSVLFIVTGFLFCLTVGLISGCTVSADTVNPPGYEHVWNPNGCDPVAAPTSAPTTK